MTTLLVGLSLGSLYILLALGYNFIFVGAAVFNFAQAQMMMVGTFAAYVGSVTLGLPLWSVPIFGAVVGFLVGLIVHYVAIDLAIRRDREIVLVSTLAIAVVLEGIVTIIFGTTPRGVPFWGDNELLSIAGGRISLGQLVTIVIAIVVGVLTWLLFSHTLIGRAAVAASEDRMAARLKGINVGLLAVMSVAIAGAFAGAIGIVVAQQTTAVPTVGNLLAIKAFVVLAIGGFGSMPGAVIGGLAVGMIEAFTARYLGGEFSLLVLFVLLLVVLLVRPSGMFVKHIVRRV